jgi:hypothetical protein
VNEVIYGGVCPFSITNPTTISACSGQTKEFSVVASGSSFVYTYQWQVNDGSGWVNLANGAPYSNVTTNKLTITGTTPALNGYRYRIKVTSNNCTKNSNYATLLVSGTLPSTPGAISGLTTQCATNTNNEIYSVAAVSGATKYNWLFPAGWNITSGTNTNIVTVTTSGAVNGNISVTASVTTVNTTVNKVVTTEDGVYGGNGTNYALFKNGGNFIVPPGYPNDNFHIGVTTGEQVIVIPNAIKAISNRLAGAQSLPFTMGSISGGYGNTVNRNATNNYYLNVNSNRSLETVETEFGIMRLLGE